MVQLSRLSDSVVFGSSITRSCTIVSQIPLATNVFWEFTHNGLTRQILVASSPGKYSGSTITTPSLTINNANNDDGGIYQCFAQNLVGLGQSSDFTLSIIGGMSKSVLCGDQYICTMH